MKIFKTFNSSIFNEEVLNIKKITYIMETTPIVGIDLGTTYSCVGIYKNNNIEIIANSFGSRITPSYVGFTDCEMVIGTAAKDDASSNPNNTVFDAKRLIGLKFNDEVVQKDIKLWPFKVIDYVGNPKIEVMYKGEVKQFYPEEISGFILGKLKETASVYLNTEVCDAVITVPAYFNDSQRQATQDAGRIAGLKVRKIINEPTAAALGYSLNKKISAKQNILIFDLGGGTFDVSIMAVHNKEFIVKAVGGDCHLGGEDFDNNMVKYFIQDIKKKYNKDISSNKHLMRKLRTGCERAKRRLSVNIKGDVDLAIGDGIDYKGTISRTKFDDINSDLFSLTITKVEETLKSSNLTKSDIDEVVLVGGSTRIVKIRNLLQEFFEGKALNESVNPEEAVAYGAAVQASILMGGVSNPFTDIVLSDVLPLSLGTDAEGDVMSVIIPKNTPVPAKATRAYQTIKDGQTEMDIGIFEGENKKASKNHVLGDFLLENLPSLPKGVAKVDVTFAVDENGILTASAFARSSGSKAEITVTNSKGRLNENQIKDMINEAKKLTLEAENHKKSEFARNDLESYCAIVKASVNNKNFNRSVSAQGKRKILTVCEETISEIETVSLQEEDFYKSTKTQIESLVKIYHIELK